MTRIPNINAITYFEAVARHSSVSLAADELMISRSAVSQQIKILEERMGVVLFRRAKRRMILTEEGERLFNAATKAITLLRETQAHVSIARDYHSLTIRTAASFGARWLSPLLADFVADYPNLDLHIDATSKLSDFETENIDIEIRYAAEMPEGMHCQLLLTDYVLPLCAPGMRSHGLGIAEFLATTRLIHTVKADTQWRRWLDLHGMHEVSALHGLYFDRTLMSLQAAQDMLGVALETVTLAMNELRIGSLVPLVPELGALPLPSYWLVCPPKHLNNQFVRAFREWVGSKAEAHEREKLTLLDSLGVAVNPRHRA